MLLLCDHAAYAFRLLRVLCVTAAGVSQGPSHSSLTAPSANDQGYSSLLRTRATVAVSLCSYPKQASPSRQVLQSTLSHSSRRNHLSAPRQDTDMALHLALRPPAGEFASRTHLTRRSRRVQAVKAAKSQRNKPAGGKEPLKNKASQKLKHDEDAAGSTGAAGVASAAVIAAGSLFLNLPPGEIKTDGGMLNPTQGAMLVAKVEVPEPAEPKQPAAPSAPDPKPAPAPKDDPTPPVVEPKPRAAAAVPSPAIMANMAGVLNPAQGFGLGNTQGAMVVGKIKVPAPAEPKQPAAPSAPDPKPKPAPKDVIPTPSVPNPKDVIPKPSMPKPFKVSAATASPNPAIMANMAGVLNPSQGFGLGNTQGAMVVGKIKVPAPAEPKQPAAPSAPDPKPAPAPKDVIPTPSVPNPKDVIPTPSVPNPKDVIPTPSVPDPKDVVPTPSVPKPFEDTAASPNPAIMANMAGVLNPAQGFGLGNIQGAVLVAKAEVPEPAEPKQPAAPSAPDPKPAPAPKDDPTPPVVEPKPSKGST
eukprot:jgi/Tetstr1/430319/TSEL_020144.t1